MVNIDELWEQEYKLAERLLNMNNNKKIKLDFDAKLMPHVYEDYTIQEINQTLSGYFSGEFNYDLKIREGDIVQGKLKRVTKTDYIFDIGYKDEVYVERKKDEERFLVEYADDNGNLILDTMVELQIVTIKTNPYLLKGSLSSINLSSTLDIMKECNKYDVYDAYIESMMNAGFNVIINVDGHKIKGFMPNLLAGINRLKKEDCESLVGQTKQVMIESFTEDRGTFIVSRKKYLKSLVPQAISKLVTKNKKGELIEFEGTVTGTTKFGIFVEFNEILTGMIYKDSMLDSIKDTFQNLKQGDKIKFFVKDVFDTKLILTQVNKETIWDRIETNQIYDGVVYDEKTIGLLVRLDDETVGLLPADEITKNKSKEKFVIGSKIKVKINQIFKKDRKITLLFA